MRSGLKAKCLYSLGITVDFTVNSVGQEDGLGSYSVVLVPDISIASFFFYLLIWARC